VRGQINNWYSSLETEIFDESQTNRVKFTPLSAEEKKKIGDFEGTGQGFMAEVVLRKRPIPASVRITRFNLVIHPNDREINGSHVSFVTPNDKLARRSGEGSPIIVQYHAAP
jgi:uncharacterized protein with FMN-binding domain